MAAAVLSWCTCWLSNSKLFESRNDLLSVQNFEPPSEHWCAIVPRYASLAKWLPAGNGLRNVHRDSVPVFHWNDFSASQRVSPSPDKIIERKRKIKNCPDLALIPEHALMHTLLIIFPLETHSLDACPLNFYTCVYSVEFWRVLKSHVDTTIWIVTICCK